MNGVIETATGDLKRSGFCDFLTDGSFDAATESHRTDVPEPSKVRGKKESHHRWNGSAWVVVEDVAFIKREKNAAIDQRTEELIRSGFLHLGKRFSLSDNAQRWLTALKAGSGDLVGGDFPIRMNTKDDLDAHDLADAAALAAFYQSGVSAIKGHRASGTALKDQVRAATTKAAVDAIVDAR